MLTSELIRIAAAGGGLRIDCSKRLTSDLIRIAASASSGGVLVILENTAHMLNSDKISIAAAGKGAILFNDRV